MFSVNAIPRASLPPASTKSLLRYLLLAPFLVALLFPAMHAFSAAYARSPWYQVRSISTAKQKISDPRGFAYSQTAEAFYVSDASGRVAALTMHKATSEPGGLHLAPGEGLMAVDSGTNSLFFLDSRSSVLKRYDPQGGDLQPAAQYDLAALDLRAAQGMSLDSRDGTLYLLNEGGSQVVILQPGASADYAAASALADRRVSRLDLARLGYPAMRGIAFNAVNGHLYLLDPRTETLVEVSKSGARLSSFDLKSLHLADPQGLLSPSSDTTDDPAQLSLFLLDGSGGAAAASAASLHGRATHTPRNLHSPAPLPEAAGGSIIELALHAPSPLPSGTVLLAATPVNIVDTSLNAWTPSAPDPAGIDYWPLTGRFLVSDSEVDEMPPYFTGVNIYDTALTGSLITTCSTTNIDRTGWSNEPTGLSINPDNNRIYISDDDKNKIFEINLGPDGLYCTADDTVTSMAFATDTEDIAYGNNTLFIAGGVNAEVYQFSLGADGALGGGDDGPITHWDTASLGFNDLEGIDYNVDNGTLFLVSTAASDKYLGEVSTSGTLLNAWDLSFMGPQANIRSDVTYAPSSANPLVKNIYIVSRGVDNNGHPLENDGRWWEISLGSEPPTPTPTITPTPTPTFTPTPDPFTKINVKIGGTSVATYSLLSGEQQRVNYPGLDSGPLVVQSTNGNPIIVALRDAWTPPGGTAMTSFAQLMGLPAGGLSDTYYFPAYNNVTLDEQLRFGNVGSADTAVSVTIGGVLRGSYFLHPGEQMRVNYAGLDSGPVVVSSSGGVKIIAALRDAWTPTGGTAITSFIQLMGLPAAQLSDTYYFPAYNNVTLNEQVRFANVGGADTTVSVTIGGVVRGSYLLHPSEQMRVNYAGLDSGPVVVKSSGGIKIIAALRDAWTPQGQAAFTSFAQLMGLPAELLSDQYIFPAYNNVTLDEQLRFGNVGIANTTVTVTIGGVVRGSYLLHPSEQARVNYAGLDSGPVTVKSSGGVKIIAALRDAWVPQGQSVTTSFVQMMGLPSGQLADSYYFPAYNNVTLNEQLRFGIP